MMRLNTEDFFFSQNTSVSKKKKWATESEETDFYTDFLEMSRDIAVDFTQKSTSPF